MRLWTMRARGVMVPHSLVSSTWLDGSWKHNHSSRSSLVPPCRRGTSPSSPSSKHIMKLVSRRVPENSMEHHLGWIKVVCDRSRKDSKVRESILDPSADPELKLALEGFENVTGILAEDVQAMFAHAPVHWQEDWKSRLLSWKDVKRGRDMFISGLSGFDIEAVYSEVVCDLRRKYVHEILSTLKAVHLRRIWKVNRANTEDTCLPSNNPSIQLPLDVIRNKLAESVDWDFFQTITEDTLKKRWVHDPVLEYDQRASAIPLFATSPSNGSNSLSSKISVNNFLACLCSGAVAVQSDEEDKEWEDEDEEYQEYRQDGDGDDEAYSRPFWLLTVSEVQTQQYFRKVLDDNSGTSIDSQKIRIALNKILAQEVSCPVREHVMKNRHFWNNIDEIGAIDEMVRVLLKGKDCFPENGESMTPRYLLNSLREQTRKRNLGPNETYPYLSSLPDNEKLQVLRSKYEINEVATKLRNCALSYCQFVEMEQCVLVSLKGGDGKPIALGMHRMDGFWTERGWEEIAETSNTLPSDETVAAFVSYNTIFRRWHREIYSPARKEDDSPYTLY
jgi:hypothetical protein